MKKTIVVKYGSASVSNAKGMDHQRLEQYARHLAVLHKTHNLVLVCSGSVAAGRNVWEKSRHTTLTDIRVLAMLGSSLAFSAWQEALLDSGVLAGQLLVTHREADDDQEGPRLRSAIEANMRAGIVTIINENDALSDTKLARLSYGGDNDGLAAHIAISLQADMLIMLTNVDGLSRKGKVVRSIGSSARSLSRAIAHVDASISALGRGGMMSKVSAASRTSRYGIETYIANANVGFDELLSGKAGTHFVAKRINGRMRSIS